MITYVSDIKTKILFLCYNINVKISNMRKRDMNGSKRRKHD